MDSLVANRLETVQDWIAAYNARDTEALIAMAVPHVELNPSPWFAPRGTSYHGADGVRSLLERQFEQFPHLWLQVRDVEETGRFVVARLLVSVDGIGPGDPQRDLTAVFEFAGARVARTRAFPRFEEAQAVVGGVVLTAREREIFALLARGLSAPEIADHLVLSPATVRTHVQNGMGKLGARTRVHAVVLAATRGEIVLQA